MQTWTTDKVNNTKEIWVTWIQIQSYLQTIHNDLFNVKQVDTNLYIYNFQYSFDVMITKAFEKITKVTCFHS